MPGILWILLKLPETALAASPYGLFGTCPRSAKSHFLIDLVGSLGLRRTLLRSTIAAPFRKRQGHFLFLLLVFGLAPARRRPYAHGSRLLSS